jgi:hypothetical protein
MTNARWRPRLAQTLKEIAGAASALKDEWWILGSAAAALSGADILEVRDVDLLLSERDARDLLARWSERRTEEVAASDQFRSTVFARFVDAPLPIDVFGEFEMRVRGDWRRIEPLTRERRGDVFTPSIAEQIALLEAMDRDKDKARIAALKARL